MKYLQERLMKVLEWPPQTLKICGEISNMLYMQGAQRIFS